MQVIRSDGLSGASDLSAHLSQKLNNNKKVLWLISGGSNIAYCVHAMAALPTEITSNLTIMLVDERYCPVGHEDSNWTQLVAADMPFKQATAIPVLEANSSFSDTVNRYQQQINAALISHDYIIAQLGIGADGHTAGILPNSPAAIESTKLVIGYTADPYQRITITFPTLKQVDSAFVFAFGDSKHDALASLVHDNIELTSQPAQILKQIDEAYLYNDQVS